MFRTAAKAECRQVLETKAICLATTMQTVQWLSSSLNMALIWIFRSNRKNEAYIQFFLNRLFDTASANCALEIKFGVPFPSLFCDWVRLRLALVVRTVLPTPVEAMSCTFWFTCRLFCNSINYMKNIRTHGAIIHDGYKQFLMWNNLI